jgi:flagellar biosynthetic protein FliR
MISFTSAELNAWIAAFFFPLARILALLAAAPPFNNAGLTTRVRLVLGLALVMAIAPALPAMPAIEPASGLGLLILAQQMIIGFAMGFVLRLVFSAIDLAGMMISTQMGLGFATAYDPQTAAQTPVVSELLGMLALLVFLSIDGHLMVLATLVKSFTLLPVGHVDDLRSQLAQHRQCRRRDLSHRASCSRCPHWSPC